jgi:hypothetical protein
VVFEEPGALAMQVQVQQVQQQDYERWDTAVASSEAGSPYSDSRYLRALCAATGGDFNLVAVMDGPRIIGGIGLYFPASGKGSIVRGRYLLYYNGPFVCVSEQAGRSANESLTRRVLSALVEYLQEGNFDRVEIKGRHPLNDARAFLDKGWQVRPVYSYEVDISSPDACFDRMHRNIRRQIRRTEQDGVWVSRSEDIDQFFSLHERTALTKGFSTYLKRVEMLDWFRALDSAGIIRLYLAGKAKGDAGAGLLVLATGHPVSHSVAAASDTNDIAPGTNAALRWHAFKDLASSGYVANDLTDAHQVDVARFKSQLGASLVLSHSISLPATARSHLSATVNMLGGNARQFLKSLLKG